MRNLFMALVVALMATLMIGGTAFAQSQPAPPAGPPQVDNSVVDRLTAAESDAASALRQAREALRRLDAAEAKIVELQGRRPTRVAPAPTSPAPSNPVPAPAPANPSDDRFDAVGTDIEALTRRIGALTAAVIGGQEDGETPAQYSERVALALARLSDPGLMAKVAKIETDVATLAAIVRDHEAKIERGFRATVGIEGVLDAGTPIEGVRPGFLSQGGLALALGHGFTGRCSPRSTSSPEPVWGWPRRTGTSGGAGPSRFPRPRSRSAARSPSGSTPTVSGSRRTPAPPGLRRG